MKYEKKRPLLIGLMLLALLLPAAGYPAQKVLLNAMEYSDGGADNQRSRKITVVPSLAVSSRLDSNYFKREKEERAVFTHLVRPGMRVGYNTAKSKISLDYTLDLHFYSDKDDVPAGERDAGDNNFVGHSLALSARTTPFKKLTLGLDDTFYRSRERNKVDRLFVDEDRGKFYTNKFSPALFYRFNDRLSTGVTYRNTITRYDENNPEDSTEHRGIADLTYHFSPTASLGVVYQRWNRSYERDNPDYTSDHGELLFRKTGKYLALEAATGYQNRQFDDDREDKDIFTYRLILGAHSPDARSYAKLGFEQDFNNSGVADNFFTATQFNLNVGHVFMERLRADVDGYYRIADYENWTEFHPEDEEREDDIYGISAGLGYQFTDWLTFKLKGGYENRDSSLDEYDYDNQYVMVGLDSVYDLGSRPAE